MPPTAPDVKIKIDPEALGRGVLESRWLLALRNHLGISRTYLAELLKASVETVKTWESGGIRNPWQPSTVRLGRFYIEVLLALQVLQESGIPITELEPMYMAAANRGWDTNTMWAAIRDETVQAVDLLELGLWVRKPETVTPQG